MASADAPMSSTPKRSRTPALLELHRQVEGGLAPEGGETASGRSRSMMAVSTSRSSGST
jgi:hypothetical protein